MWISVTRSRPANFWPRWKCRNCGMQLNNAIAVEAKGRSDYTNAHLIYTPAAICQSVHPNLVAQQELDTADANDSDTLPPSLPPKLMWEIQNARGLHEDYRAVRRRRHLSLRRPGRAHSGWHFIGSQSLPLVRVSDNYLLRLDFPVSVRLCEGHSRGRPGGSTS